MTRPKIARVKIAIAPLSEQNHTHTALWSGWSRGLASEVKNASIGIYNSTETKLRLSLNKVKTASELGILMPLSQEKKETSTSPDPAT